MIVSTPIPVGTRVRFQGEKIFFRVKASDVRFAVCTRPQFGTVLYTVIDSVENRRGPENLVFGMGAETEEQCREMLDRLNGRGDTCGASEVSHRHDLPLDIAEIKTA